MDPEPLVSVGDRISISWPTLEGSLGNFTAEVTSLRRLRAIKKGSWYKYSLILDYGDTVTTTLSNREWRLLEKGERGKIQVQKKADKKEGDNEKQEKRENKKDKKDKKEKLEKRKRREEREVAATEGTTEKRTKTKTDVSKVLPLHRYICAPMVGASELAFRLLCRKYGTQLAYTPMINRFFPLLFSPEKLIYVDLSIH